MPGGGLIAISELGLAEGEFGPTLTELKLVRLRADGRLDQHFGQRGRATVTLPAQEEKLTVTPTGGILAVGSDRGEQIAITLVSPRGRLDTRFDANARMAQRSLPSPGYRPFGIPLFGGGIEILGWTEAEGGYALRLRSDGHLDTRFGEGGRQLLEFDPLAGAAVAGGLFALTESESSTVSVIRLGADGTPDPGFNGGRPLAVPLPGVIRPSVTPIGRNGVIVSVVGNGRCTDGSCSRIPYAVRLIESRPAVA